MRCLSAVRGVTRADRLQTVKISADTFTPESITDVIRTEGGLGMFETASTTEERKAIEEVSD